MGIDEGRNEGSGRLYRYVTASAVPILLTMETSYFFPKIRAYAKNQVLRLEHGGETSRPFRKL